MFQSLQRAYALWKFERRQERKERAAKNEEIERKLWVQFPISNDVKNHWNWDENFDFFISHRKLKWPSWSEEESVVKIYIIDMVDWLDSNCVYGYRTKLVTDKYLKKNLYLIFNDENDAVHYKIKWG
jgi:hypothetical protein